MNTPPRAANELIKQDGNLLRSLRQSEREKNILLSLSNEIASVKDKMELLPILRNKLRKNAFYSDLAISVINEDGKTTSGYLINWQKRRHTHPDYEKESVKKHPLNDGIFDVTLQSKMPVFFNLSEIVKKETVPTYIRFLYDRGIRDMIAVALRDRNKEIGLLYLFSRQKKVFSAQQLQLLQGMSQQLAIAVANIRAHEAMQQEQREKEILLSISYDIARIKDKHALLEVINSRLRSLFLFDSCSICLSDKEKDTIKVFLLDPNSKPAKNDELLNPFLNGVYAKDKIIEKILASDYPVVIDVDKEILAKNAPLYIKVNHSLNIKEIISVSLRNEEGSFGFFNLLSSLKNGFTKNQLNILHAAGNQVSIAVANILSNEELREKENEKSFLLTVSKEISSCQNRADVLHIVNKRVAKLVHCDIILLCLNNDDNETHSNYLHTIPKEIEQHSDFATMATLKYYINDGFYNVIQESEDPVIFDVDELMLRRNRPFYFDFWHANNIKEMVGISIRVNNKPIGAVVLHAKEKHTFSMSELKLAQGVCSHIGITLSNMRAYEQIQAQLEEINRYKSRLEQENIYLQEQIKTVYNHSEIIGSSAEIKKVFELVNVVAPSPSTVLLQGETGTGKELIARAIHNASNRKHKLMVKVNCATLPAQLIESELFGHERGSFTGATDRRIGKFELANNSTLFLDEIGEMPLELQAKLLRAIQEKEIERLGGKGVIKTDVRLIAATNRNLQKEVEAGKFRSDLYYRLNVFPITLPPLRERTEDIPILVQHFVAYFSVKTGKKISNISPKVLKQMMDYHWPGNVRELEHVIERSVLLATGSNITDVQLAQNQKQSSQSTTDLPFTKSLEQNERDYILSVLNKTNGRIRGFGGAAEILAIPPTTLHSKIKKLGIQKLLK